MADSPDLETLFCVTPEQWDNLMKRLAEPPRVIPELENILRNKTPLDWVDGENPR